MKPIRRHFSYANVMSTMAFIFAMGGTAVAANHYLITKTSQIKPSVLRSLRGRTGSMGAQGASGASGPVGSPGPSGREGKNGPASLGPIVEVRASAPVFEIKNAVTIVSVQCPAKTVVVSGGFSESAQGAVPIVSERLENGWSVHLETQSSTLPQNGTAIAYCRQE